ncbi:Universal stress protein [Tenacibaculum sp. 190130A14a]|uniref:Universal stress protein n=1 Tax=Tenacibaculum polynesiense TaxID=3137857 RepID=A0ABP1F0Z5_9FLAO
MKTILLPTDFSENSWNAIEYALKLFKNQECTFYILNTYIPSIYHMNYMPSSVAYTGVTDALKESSLKNLAYIARKISEEFSNEKHHVETVSSLNMLVSEIRSLIREKSIDIIVMGTQGATGAIEKILGTNTMTVINDIECPTIAVPEGFKFDKIEKILFPTDFQLFYLPYHVDPIVNIAQLHEAHIDILHVLAKDFKELDDVQDKNRLRLKSFLKGTNNTFLYTEYEEIPKAVDTFLMKNPTDLIVMMNNKNSFFDNVFFKPIINKIGFHLKVPFLVIPSKK